MYRLIVCVEIIDDINIDIVVGVRDMLGGEDNVDLRCWVGVMEI